MIILVIFLSFWFGISVRCSIIIYLILISLLLIFIIKRINKKVLVLSLITMVIGVGISFISFDYNRTSFTGVVTESKDNYYIFQSKLQKFYVYEKGNEHEIGDWLTLEGTKENLIIYKIESEFDFEEYLNKKGIKYEINVKKKTKILSNPIKLKKIKKRFLNHFNDDTRDLISAILFSEINDNGVVDNLNSLHLVKLVSASGFYIYLFLKTIEHFLNKKMKEKWSRLISISFLSIYAIFTFPRFTVLRTFTFLIFGWINKYKLKNKFSRIEQISLIGIAFLFINYHYVYSDSFVLGFSIPIFNCFFSPIISRFKKKKQLLYRTLGMMLFFLPFELKFYSCVSPLSSIIGYLISPVFSLFGILALLCFYGVPLYKILEGITFILGKITSVFSIAKLEIYSPPFNSLFIVIYYVFYIFILYAFYIGYKPSFKNGRLLSICLLGLYFLPLKNVIIKRVCFINVGQGDSCLIQNGTTTVLIDTGGSLYNDIGNDCLIPYFKKNRIYNIDYVITTHNDFDHVGALESLVKNFRVKHYVNSNYSFPLTISGITFNNYNTHIDSGDDNENSLVIGFNFLKKDFLIMGDAPISVEYQIIKEYPKLSCDILKVGHHGSSTSTSDRFINFLKPKEGVISVGRNYYGHPDKSVLTILKKYDVKIRRTDKEGTIVYSNYIFM